MAFVLSDTNDQTKRLCDTTVTLDRRETRPPKNGLNAPVWWWPFFQTESRQATARYKRLNGMNE